MFQSAPPPAGPPTDALPSGRATRFQEDSRSVILRERSKVRGISVKGMGMRAFRIIPLTKIPLASFRFFPSSILHLRIRCGGPRCACAPLRCIRPPPPRPVSHLVTRTRLAYKRAGSREKRGFSQIIARPPSLAACATRRNSLNKHKIVRGTVLEPAKNGNLPGEHRF